RVRKGCSGIETHLFENMLEIRKEDAEEEVQVSAHDHVDQENVIEEIADDVPLPTSPLPPSPIIPSSHPHQSPKASPSQAAEGTSILVQQVLAKCSALVLRVEGLKSTNTAQQLEILKLNARVKKLERLNKVKSSKLRRLKKVGIELVDDQEKDVQVKGRQADTQAEIYNIDLDHTSKVLSMQEDSEVQEVVEVVEVVNAAKLMTESAKDKGKGILVEDLKLMKKKDQIAMDAEYARKLQEEEESLAQTKDAQATDVQPKDAPAKGIQYIRRYHGYKKKPQSESEARKNMIDYLKNTERFKLAFFKGKTYDQIRPIFQARFDANMRFLLKSKEEMEKEEEEIIKSINETPAQKLEVVADEDDDVFVEATPIGTKVPVVNYEVVMINNKSRKGCSGIETHLFENMLEIRKEDAEEEVQVSAHDHVDQENVIEEIADDVPLPTSPLPPSPIIPSSHPHQSPKASPSQAAEGTSILVQQVLAKCSALVLRVEGLESTNTAQQLEILKLNARVKKLERLNKGRISVDINEGIELVDDQEKDVQLLELMLLKRPKENTKCVSATGEELTAAREMLMLLG
nr:hypothetical protein [Tanacetum cinerariifolium]